MRRPRHKTETERWIKDQVKEILEDDGWFVWMPAANVFGRNGASDFLAVKQPARFMAVETKYKDVVTAMQFNFLKAVHDAGHYAFLVDETNLDDLRRQLEPKLFEQAHVIETLLKWQAQSPTGEFS